MLVDSHCHLDFPDFADELDAVVARAQAAGIGRMVTISTRVRRHARSAGDRRALSRRLLLGRHPSAPRRTRSSTSATADLVARARHPKVVAIGEAGLDYHYDNSPARRAGAGLPPPHRRGARDRPAAGHPCARGRRRHGAHPARRKREGRLPGRAALLHRRPRAGAAPRIALGLYVSFTGILTFKNSDELRAIAAGAAGRPHPGRDRRALSRAAAVSAASATSRPMWSRPPRCWPRRAASRSSEIARQTTENFFRLFAKVPRAGRGGRMTSDASPFSAAARPCGVPRPALGWGACDPEQSEEPPPALLAAGRARAARERHHARPGRHLAGPARAAARRRGRLARRRALSPTSTPTTPTASTICAALFVQAPQRVDVYLDEPTSRVAARALRLLLRDAARQRVSADR